MEEQPIAIDRADTQEYWLYVNEVAREFQSAINETIKHENRFVKFKLHKVGGEIMISGFKVK